MTTFLRILDASIDEKASALLRAIRGSESHRVFVCDPATFSRVPGSPFAYWVGDNIRSLFVRLERVDQGRRSVRVGVATGDDARFLRLWWETSDSDPTLWPSLAKGGAFSRFYADLPLVIDWRKKGEPIELSFVGARVKKPDFGRPGLTWPARTNGLSIRVMPSMSIFTHKGPAVFCQDNSADDVFALASVMNSRIFSYLIGVQLARTELAQSYEVGLVQQTPIPSLSDNDTITLARLARRAWSLKRLLDTVNETSHAFLLPRGKNEKAIGRERAEIERELAAIQNQVDESAFALYNIGPEERAAVDTFANAVPDREPAQDDDDDDDGLNGDQAVNAAWEATAISWLVGVAFHRFDRRLATGERPIPPEPDPFERLPSLSPGMYPEGEEPTDRPDILVDDEGHADDLALRALAVAECVQINAPENLRGWLAKEFFPLHIRTYSKSRRKAPIYWQLATASASYSAWLYIHAFTKDTLFRVQNDYAAPKLAHEERRLNSLREELRDGATAAQRKQVAAQEALVEELRAFLDELKRVAPLWNPNLDDGVIINFAPLWRLVPQNKSWQKELKATWDALCEGEYDWAHLAMHLWPERVVPTCAKDRSLAIAHNLEDVFWVEGADGKWTDRKKPTKSVDQLVKERSSSSVKSALKSLLDAPAAGGKTVTRGRGEARRKSVAAVEEDV